MESLNTLNNSHETTNRSNDWDILKDTPSPAQEISADTHGTETIDRQPLVTSQEIYNQLFSHLNATINNPNMPPDGVQETRNSRNLLMEVYFEHQDDPEDPSSLIANLTNRQQTYNKMATAYQTIQDEEAARHAASLSATAAKLIQQATNVKANLEYNKNPHSATHRFIQDEPPIERPAQDNAALFK